MKPDIIKKTMGFSRSIDGYVGVYCGCGHTLYIKNDQSKAGQGVSIECPCGATIYTVYTRYSCN